MMKHLTVACLLTLAFANLCAAQKSKNDEYVTTRQMDEETRNREALERLGVREGNGSLPAELKGAYKPAELPKGKDAWVVQVFTRGGFTGRGRGDVTITSAGDLRCSASVFDACASRLSPAALESLSKLVANANPKKWKDTPGGACRDCYVALIVLQRRDAKGRGKSYNVYFDDSMLPKMPEEVGRIYTQAFALAAPPK